MSIKAFNVNGEVIRYDYASLDNKPNIPSKTSDLTNDSGFVNATGAAAAAPVKSVNGQTGNVNISVPSAATTAPADLGASASAGDGTTWARSNHVHKRPTAAEIGAYVKPSSGIPASDLSSDVQSDLAQIGDLKADQYKPYPHDTATGSIANFPDGAALPVRDLSVDIEPVQAGSGDPSPDNIRPISGWTECKVTRTGKNLFDSSIFPASASQNILYVHYAVPNGTYTMSTPDFPLVGGLTNVFFLAGSVSSGATSGSSGISQSTPRTITVTDGYYTVAYRSSNDTNTNNPKDFKWQIELGSTATAYEPYQGETYSITFPTSAGTVYGGTLDVTTGKLTVDSKIVDLSTYAWTKENDDLVYAVDRTISMPQTPTAENYRGVYATPGGAINMGNGDIAVTNSAATPVIRIKYTNIGNDVTLRAGNAVFKIPTPTVYDLTPIEVNTLLAHNNIWADCGDTTVNYRADTTLFINKKIAALAAAMN